MLNWTSGRNNLARLFLGKALVMQLINGAGFAG